MRPPKEMSAVIGGLRYSVDKATLIASDAYWDGHNWERQGRNSFLYRTPNGTFTTPTISIKNGTLYIDIIIGMVWFRYRR